MMDAKDGPFPDQGWPEPVSSGDWPAAWPVE
jgi:hypothetical protein